MLEGSLSMFQSFKVFVPAFLVPHVLGKSFDEGKDGYAK
jgi:hypothetical protein